LYVIAESDALTSFVRLPLDSAALIVESAMLHRDGSAWQQQRRNSDARFFRFLHFVGEQGADPPHRKNEEGLAQAQPNPVTPYRNGGFRATSEQERSIFNRSHAGVLSKFRSARLFSARLCFHRRVRAFDQVAAGWNPDRAVTAWRIFAAGVPSSAESASTLARESGSRVRAVRETRCERHVS
jgi:hypothetical protein